MGLRPALINGKRMRAPDLERLDATLPTPTTQLMNPASSVRDFKAGLYLDKDAPRTWERDKALLVALGVDGDVPFNLAAVNAGLDWVIGRGGVKHAWRAANDNEIAAKAA